MSTSSTARSAGPSRSPPFRAAPSMQDNEDQGDAVPLFAVPNGMDDMPDAPPSYNGTSGRTASRDPVDELDGEGDDDRREGEMDGLRDEMRQMDLGAPPGEHLASVTERKRLYWRSAAITGVFIVSWFVFATLLALYNKWMFSPQFYGFSYPLFVTTCHFIVQWLCAAIIRAAVPSFRPEERPTRRQYVLKVFPTAASTGGDIGLSNLSLKTITLSLYTMCKSSTLIFVLFFAFAFRLESYSLRLVLVISLISFGVFCMVFNTTAVSLPGIIMVFSASALAGLRWALTETLMHKKSMGMSNPFATIFWLAPLMALTLAVVSIFVEGWFEIFGSPAFDGFWMVLRTVAVILLPGCIAFAMVASEYFIIQRAGIVPMSVAGICKEVTTISISAWVFGDQLTEINIIGVVITVCGIATYSWHKYQKSISEPIAIDSHGKPHHLHQNESETRSMRSRRSTQSATYTPIRDNTETSPLRRSIALNALEGGYGPAADPKIEQVQIHLYPPTPPRGPSEEDREERTNRLRDDFEGYNDRDSEHGDEDGEEEFDLEPSPPKVSWWDRPM